jgi:YHS domain-containing protein
MKTFGTILGVLAVSAAAWALQAGPVNTDCPVKTGTPAKPGITSSYKGKTVAFCCGNCKGQFDSDPEKFVANIPGLAPPQPRSALNSLEEAVKSAQSGGKVAVLLFSDGGAKSKQFSLMLADASLDEAFGKVAYAMVEFTKDAADAKKLKVTAAPALLILDVSKEEPKELKKMTGGAPPTVKKEIEAALKKVASGK